MVKDGFILGVELYYVLAVRSNEGDIVENLLIGVGVVYIDAFKVGVENVAQHTYNSAFFLKHKGRGFG